MTRIRPIFIRHIFLLPALALLVTALPAAATLTTEANTDPPQNEMLLAYDTSLDQGSYDWSHGTGVAVSFGQTFRLESADGPATLNAITLKIVPRSAIGARVVTLTLGTYSDAFDVTMDQVLATETGVLPANLAVGQVSYVTFDFPDLTLAGGRFYGFLLEFEGGGAVNDAEADVRHLGDDVYPGRAFRVGGAFTDPLPDDLVFFVHCMCDTALRFHEGRFLVEAQWRDFQDGVGPGVGTPMTHDAGYFWFFDADNVEVLVKVLDACVEPFQHFWVFSAGLTNVEVTLTVTDTWAQETRTYVNPLTRPYPPILDAAAFATCDVPPPM